MVRLNRPGQCLLWTLLAFLIVTRPAKILWQVIQWKVSLQKSSLKVLIMETTRLELLGILYCLIYCIRHSMSSMVKMQKKIEHLIKLFCCIWDQMLTTFLVPGMNILWMNVAVILESTASNFTMYTFSQSNVQCHNSLTCITWIGKVGLSNQSAN